MAKLKGLDLTVACARVNATDETGESGQSTFGLGVLCAWVSGEGEGMQMMDVCRPLVWATTNAFGLPMRVVMAGFDLDIAPSSRL